MGRLYADDAALEAGMRRVHDKLQAESTPERLERIERALALIAQGIDAHNGDDSYSRGVREILEGVA